MAPYGRSLRGFGAVPDTSEYGDTWAGQDEALRQAAIDDDTVGNGIFDGPGAPPTAHAGTGVFASSFSLPGYLYREQPGKPSEVVDTTTGAPMVYQPNAGGSWYEDTYESYHPFDVEVPRMYSNDPVFPPKAMGGFGAYHAVNSANASQIAGPVFARGIAGFGATDPAAASADKTGQYVRYALGGVLVGAALALAMKFWRE